MGAVTGPENGGEGGLSRWQAPPVCLLVPDLARTFSNITVVIDQSRLAGIPRGRLAGRLGRVAFARLRSGAHLGDASTISACSTDHRRPHPPA